MYTYHPDPLGFMLAELNRMQSLFKSIKYSPDDIRHSFYGMQFDILNNYYLTSVALEIAKIIPSGDVMVSAEAVPSEHIRRLMELGIEPGLEQSFKNNNHRRILIDSWSAFEFAVSVICAFILTQREQDELLSEQYDTIIGKLNGVVLEPKHVDRLKKALTKKHLPHVPINRKCDMLFKKVHNYPRSIATDKEFLLFYGRYRNCIHSNYFYYGTDCDYTFGDVKFEFRNGQSLFQSEYDSTYKVRLLIELITIFTALVSSIDHDALIPYPDPTAP